MAARSKASFCGPSLAGIAGSNPAGDMDVCGECCVLSEVSAKGRPLVQRVPTESVCVCVSLSVIRCNNNSHNYNEQAEVTLEKKERKTEGKKERRY